MLNGMGGFEGPLWVRGRLPAGAAEGLRSGAGGVPAAPLRRDVVRIRRRQELRPRPPFPFPIRSPPRLLFPFNMMVLVALMIRTVLLVYSMITTIIRTDRDCMIRVRIRFSLTLSINITLARRVSYFHCGHVFPI